MAQRLAVKPSHPAFGHLLPRSQGRRDMQSVGLFYFSVSRYAMTSCNSVRVSV